MELGSSTKQTSLDEDQVQQSQIIGKRQRKTTTGSMSTDSGAGNEKQGPNKRPAKAAPAKKGRPQNSKAKKQEASDKTVSDDEQLANFSDDDEEDDGEEGPSCSNEQARDQR